MKRLFKKRTARRQSSQHQITATRKLEYLEKRTLLTINGIAIDSPVDLDAGDMTSADVDQQQAMGPERLLRIVNGEQSTAFDSVGIVNNGCTGTLIAPNAVLTAAHCVTPGESSTFVVNGKIYTAQPQNVHVHPDYQSNDIDLAILILDRPVDGIEPSLINRTPPKVGDMLTLVGYGATGNGNTGHNNDFGVKHVGQTPLDELTNDLLIWNFDNNNESNTAPGDSGGPAYVDINGTLYIAGVTSGGTKADASIGDQSYDTRVDTHAAWIDSIVAAAASTGDTPVDDTPVDDAPVDDGPVDDGPVDDMPFDDFPMDDGDFGDELTPEELASEELELYDTNNDGKLSKKELIREFMDFGESRRDARKLAKNLIQDFDANNDRKLDFDELVASYGGYADNAFGDQGDWWNLGDGGNDWFAQDNMEPVDDFFGSFGNDWWW